MGSDKLAETRTCLSCGGTFDLTVGEVAWFADRGLATPRRCKLCREYRRRLARESNMHHGEHHVE